VAANVQETKVLVTEKGYEPAKMTLRAGTPARITFGRNTDKTCGTEVVFPSRVRIGSFSRTRRK
jgi:plastocyanin domain-containing protein